MDKDRKHNIDKTDEDDQEQSKKTSEKSEGSSALSESDHRSRSPTPRLPQSEDSVALSVPDQRSRSPSPRQASSRPSPPRFLSSRSPSPRQASSRSPSPRSPGRIISSLIRSITGKKSNVLSAEGEAGPARSPSPKKQPKEYISQFLVAKSPSPTPSEESRDTVSTSLSGQSKEDVPQFNITSHRKRSLTRTSSADDPSADVSSAKRSTSAPPQRPAIDLLTSDYSSSTVDVIGGSSQDVPTDAQLTDSRHTGSETPRQEARDERSVMVLPSLPMEVSEDDAEAGSSAPPSGTPQKEGDKSKDGKNPPEQKRRK